MGAEHLKPEVWAARVPGALYFDGRCEVICNATSNRTQRRCFRAATAMNLDGFAVCRVHARKLVFLDEGELPKNYALGYDPDAAEFRWRAVSPATEALRRKVQEIQAQWEF